MAYKEKTDAIRYNNQFIKQAYDRINLTVPKGQKDIIQAHAQAQGESVNGFIGRAIAETMEHDTFRPEEIFCHAVDALASHFNRSRWDIIRWLEDGERSDKREMEPDTLKKEEIFCNAVKDLAHHFNSSERDVIRWLIDGSQADKEESEELPNE